MRHSRSDLNSSLLRRFSQGGHRSASSGGLVRQVPEDAMFHGYSNTLACYAAQAQRSWSYSSQVLGRREQSPSPHYRSISTVQEN